MMEEQMPEIHTVFCTYIKAMNIIFYTKFLYVKAHKINRKARKCERTVFNISTYRIRKEDPFLIKSYYFIKKLKNILHFIYYLNT
jgi:hypothetical protein